MEGDRKNIVVIGGGTGTHTVLKGLKRYRKQLNLTAVVSMADSGGSTGRLRDEFGYLPVGDVRMALAALAREADEHEELVRQLFLHRFEKGEGLAGHNVGNLLLVALTDILGSEEAAIRAAATVLRVEGDVVPVTTESVDLVATYDDGRVVTGEHFIDEPAAATANAKITNLAVSPAAELNPRAEAAILDADLVVLGPGDLYTSVLANCVVPGMKEVLRHTSAPIVYVSNLMTRRGQTTGMGVGEHVAEIVRHIDVAPAVVLANTGDITANLLERYAKEDEYPVAVTPVAAPSVVQENNFLASEEVVTSTGDVLRRSLVRHDSRKLAQALVDVLRGTTPLLP